MTTFIDDRAENSIMQTITIAVSAILIAAGLVTAPGLINNARDTNARDDLANVALAQEFSLSDSGKYSTKVMPGVKGDGSLDELEGGPKYTLSGGGIVTATTCGTSPDAYVMTTMSKSGKQFWRVSEDSNTYSNEADVRNNLAACLTGVDLGIGSDSGTTTPDDNTWSNDAPVGSYFNRQGNFLGSIGPYGQIFVDSPSSKQLEQLKDVEPAVYHVYNPEADLLLKSKSFSDTPGEITYEGRVIARFTDSVITEYSNAANTSQANIGILVNDLYYPELRDIHLSFTGKAKISYPSLNLDVPMMANPDQMAQWNPAGVVSSDYTFLRSSGKLSDAVNESIMLFDANGVDVSHSSYQFYNKAGLSNPFPASSSVKNTPTDIYYSPTGDSGTFSKVGETNKLMWSPSSISQLKLPDLSKYDDAAGTWKLVTHLNGDSYTFMGNIKM
jgi:type II secretory pathway pseudopilin PulG